MRPCGALILPINPPYHWFFSPTTAQYGANIDAVATPTSCSAHRPPGSAERMPSTGSQIVVGTSLDPQAHPKDDRRSWRQARALGSDDERMRLGMANSKAGETGSMRRRSRSGHHYPRPSCLLAMQNVVCSPNRGVVAPLRQALEDVWILPQLWAS